MLGFSPCYLIKLNKSLLSINLLHSNDSIKVTNINISQD